MRIASPYMAGSPARSSSVRLCSSSTTSNSDVLASEMSENLYRWFSFLRPNSVSFRKWR